MEAEDYIIVLENLSIDGICQMPQIEWWLLKHHDFYNKISEIESKKYWFTIEGESIRLPPRFNKPSKEEKFLNVYSVLDTLSKFHRNENYFKQEIAIYKRIENEPQKILKWLAKNEELGANEYVCFSPDYFGDEDEMENLIHLQPFFLKDKDRQLFINREDFISTIEFLYIFNNIYWELLGDFSTIKQLI